jgi:hypothetical protein
MSMALAILLFLVCSSEPKDTPKTEWVTRTLHLGIEIRHPPYWEFDQGDETTIFLTSPDGAERIEIQIYSAREARTLYRALADENGRKAHRCELAGKPARCLAWQNRSGEHEARVTFGKRAGVEVTLGDPARWKDQTPKILATLRVP